MFPAWPHFLPGEGEEVSVPAAQVLGAGGTGLWSVSLASFSDLRPCACVCLSVRACFSLDYTFILAPGQTCNGGQQQPPLSGWNRVFYYSELILYHQQTIHFLFQTMNEHSEHRRFQRSSLEDFTDNLLHYKNYFKSVSLFFLKLL